MLRILISRQIWRSLKELEESYKGKNENKIQRDLAVFMHYVDEFKEIRDSYYASIRRTKDITKKEILINRLQFVGEPDKSDCVYADYWQNLLKTLNECGILTNKETNKLIKRIEKIFFR